MQCGHKKSCGSGEFWREENLLHEMIYTLAKCSGKWKMLSIGLMSTKYRMYENELNISKLIVI